MYRSPLATGVLCTNEDGVQDDARSDLFSNLVAVNCRRHRRRM